MSAPDPLVPADVDLRDFGYMPLDVVRLRDSDVAALPDAEAFRCAVLSWCVAWHQVPAASLPDDDVQLARLLGFGRDVKGWKKARDAGALRGYVMCSDGRLYHRTVAEKALEAWGAKQAQRARTEAARRAREKARQEQSQGAQREQSQGLSQTDLVSVTDAVTASKGREGKGRDIEIHPPTPQGGTPAKPARVPVGQFPPSFDRFWEAYPRKVGKAEAAKAFARLRPSDALLATILDALDAQCRWPQWTKDGGAFVPHAATWLNGRRWEDDPGQPRRADDIFAGAL